MSGKKLFAGKVQDERINTAQKVPQNQGQKDRLG